GGPMHRFFCARVHDQRAVPTCQKTQRRTDRVIRIALATTAAVLTFFVAQASAEDGVLQGAVHTQDGAPAAGVSIDIMQPARRVVSSRQIAGGADGTFMATGRACGDYVVRAGNGLRRVNVKRQTSITLKVSRQVIQAMTSAGTQVPNVASPTRALM